MTDKRQSRIFNWALAAGVTLSGAIALRSFIPSANAIESQMVTLQFEGMVGEAPFACGETYSLGTPASPMTPLDFRFYVSEVALIDAAGNEVPLVLQQDGKWQHQDVALIDFEDKSGACANGTPDTRAQVVGSVPAGDYTGVKFTLGVPFAMNHVDSTLAPSPLNLTSLWWNWNFGYKFARIDLAPATDAAQVRQHTDHGGTGDHGGAVQHGDGTGDSGNQKPEAFQGFAFHLGSVGCQMDSTQAPVVCGSPNRAEVVFADFDPAQDVIVADLAALVANTNLTENQENTAVGCMSSPDDNDCAGLMQSLGLPFNDQPVLEQTFFSVK
ncbi:MAG: MbnP family copper-binding protein [Cyanobacteria bacterium P01_G01_bin.38]